MSCYHQAPFTPQCDFDKCSSHSYYGMEERHDFCYIALEQAKWTLDDYVKDSYDGPKCDDISILEQATEGLKWLQDINISKL